MLRVGRVSPLYRIARLGGRSLLQCGVRHARAYTGLPTRPTVRLPRLSTTSFAAIYRNYSDLPPHVIVKLPALSPTMDTGTIMSWDKSVGDEIEQGDVLAQVETDKATMDMEANSDGYMAKILVPEGTTEIAIGREVCIIVENQEDISSFENYVSAEPSPQAASKPAQPEVTPAVQEQRAPPTPAQTEAPPTQQPAPSIKFPSRTLASPFARTVAKEKGMDLQGANIDGSGTYGSIVSGDLDRVPQEVKAPVQEFGDYEDMPHSQTRKTIARRLSEAKSSIPHYYVTYDIDMSSVLKLRKELNAMPDIKISVNDILIKAVATAIRHNPIVNCEWRDDVIRRHNQVHVSVAVDTKKGLITPVVREADAKGLKQISADMSLLREKAVNGKLTPEEYQGGTFTISNMGMKGARQFTAIINPPQACILAVGSVEKRPVHCEDNIAGFKMADMMTVTLSSDHRAVDGAQAADWLQHLKTLLENPNTLLL